TLPKSVAGDTHSRDTLRLNGEGQPKIDLPPELKQFGRDFFRQIEDFAKWLKQVIRTERASQPPGEASVPSSRWQRWKQFWRNLRNGSGSSTPPPRSSQPPEQAGETGKRVLLLGPGGADQNFNPNPSKRYSIPKLPAVSAPERTKAATIPPAVSPEPSAPPPAQ